MAGFWDKAVDLSDSVGTRVENSVDKMNDNAARNSEGWADVKGRMGETADAVKTSAPAKTLGKAGKFAKGLAGKTLIGTAAVAALVAAPFVINDMKNKRRYAPAALPPEPAPLPPAMDFTPPDVASPTTLMGMEPTPGRFAAAIDAQRSGLDAGVNPGNPGLMDVDGSGKQPQSLGAIR